MDGPDGGADQFRDRAPEGGDLGAEFGVDDSWATAGDAALACFGEAFLDLAADRLLPVLGDGSGVVEEPGSGRAGGGGDASQGFGGGTGLVELGSWWSVMRPSSRFPARSRAFRHQEGTAEP